MLPCASSLYAIKMALVMNCKLEQNLMLAGAVQCHPTSYLSTWAFLYSMPIHQWIKSLFPFDKESAGLVSSEGRRKWCC